MHTSTPSNAFAVGQTTFAAGSLCRTSVSIRSSLEARAPGKSCLKLVRRWYGNTFWPTMLPCSKRCATITSNSDTTIFPCNNARDSALQWLVKHRFCLSSASEQPACELQGIAERDLHMRWMNTSAHIEQVPQSTSSPSHSGILAARLFRCMAGDWPDAANQDAAGTCHSQADGVGRARLRRAKITDPSDRHDEKVPTHSTAIHAVTPPHKRYSRAQAVQLPTPHGQQQRDFLAA